MILVIAAAVDVYLSSRPVPVPDVVIEPVATAIALTSMVSSRSSPAVVDADPKRASTVVTNMRASRSSSTRVNTASVDRPGMELLASIAAVKSVLDATSASAVVTTVGGTRSSFTRVNTASVDRPGIAAAAIVIVLPT